MAIDFLHHLLHIDAQGGLPVLGDFHVDLSALAAEKFHLGHVRHPQQLLADFLGEVILLGPAVSVRANRVDDAEHIAKFVVDVGTLDAVGHPMPHVIEFLARGVPDIRDFLRRRGIAEFKKDRQFSGLGVATYFVCIGHFLQRRFQTVTDLFHHLHGIGAGPENAHGHDAEVERRVLVLPQTLIGIDTGDQ